MSPALIWASGSAADSRIHSKEPASQSSTVPIPYPEGITPSKSP